MKKRGIGENPYLKEKKRSSPPEAAPASLKGPLFPTPIPPPPPPPPLCINNWSSSSKGRLSSAIGHPHLKTVSHMPRL